MSYTVRKHNPYDTPDEEEFDTIEDAKEHIKYQLQSRLGTYLYHFSLYVTPKDIDIEDLRVYQRPHKR